MAIWQVGQNHIVKNYSLFGPKKIKCTKKAKNKDLEGDFEGYFKRSSRGCLRVLEGEGGPQRGLQTGLGRGLQKGHGKELVNKLTSGPGLVLFAFTALI